MRAFSRIRRDSENHKNAYNREGESSRFSRGCIRLGDNLSRLAASALLHGLAEKVFDLTVDAAQLVLRPGFELGPERRIDAQKKGLSFHHPCQSVIQRDRKSTRLNSSHLGISYAVFCLKKKKKKIKNT